jgi:hypothetical protein
VRRNVDQILERMKSRRFYIVSLILAVLALSAQLWAMGFASRSLHMRARAITGPPAQKAQRLAEAKEHSRQFPFYYSAGWAFALGSVALVVVSSRKREPISRSIPVGLLAGYVLLQFCLI